MKATNIGEFLKKYNLFSQHFDLFFYSKPADLEEISGLLVDNHCGIEFIRKNLPEDFHVYAIRHSDYDTEDPATIEMNEVIVNFFGYFICRENLDDIFNGEDYIEIVDYNYANEARAMYDSKLGIPTI